MSTPYYNRTIRKLVVGFGNLFKDITLVRYNPNLSEAERFLVPIAYASKESYVMRLEEDYDLDKKVQMTLPRMSFEMMGMTYDTSRKLNTNVRNFAASPGGAIAQYNPVPYDFDFNLYLYVRNIEDGTQLIEHILPYFTPDYTIKLNMVPEMGIIKEIPIVLNSCQQDITYEGNREKDPRMVIWTLNFTVKGYIFGKPSSTGLITHSITSIYNEITPEQVIEFSIDGASGTGTYQIGEDVFQGYTRSTAIATGKVVFWSNAYNKLQLTNVNGDFVSTQPIYGVNTLANYKFTSYNITPQKYAQIDITPKPAGANVRSSYTANTIIKEFN
jgi:hypothetical protein